MDYKKLEKATTEAIREIDAYTAKHGDEPHIKSIKNQMQFIQQAAKNQKNPALLLGNDKFTYSVIASREFSSPEELKIKSLLDRISSILDA